MAWTSLESEHLAITPPYSQISSTLLESLIGNLLASGANVVTEKGSLLYASDVSDGSENRLAELPPSLGSVGSLVRRASSGLRWDDDFLSIEPGQYYGNRDILDSINDDNVVSHITGSKWFNTIKSVPINWVIGCVVGYRREANLYFNMGNGVPRFLYRYYTPNSQSYKSLVASNSRRFDFIGVNRYTSSGVYIANRPTWKIPTNRIYRIAVIRLGFERYESYDGQYSEMEIVNSSSALEVEPIPYYRDKVIRNFPYPASIFQPGGENFIVRGAQFDSVNFIGRTSSIPAVVPGNLCVGGFIAVVLDDDVTTATIPTMPSNTFNVTRTSSGAFRVVWQLATSASSGDGVFSNLVTGFDVQYRLPFVQGGQTSFVTTAITDSSQRILNVTIPNSYYGVTDNLATGCNVPYLVEVRMRSVNSNADTVSPWTTSRYIDVS